MIIIIKINKYHKNSNTRKNNLKNTRKNKYITSAYSSIDKK